MARPVVTDTEAPDLSDIATALRVIARHVGVDLTMPGSDQTVQDALVALADDVDVWDEVVG